MTSTAGPLVSIGLPTFNRSAVLERAIASVLKQDYPHIELVVSDNASTDGTEDLCRRLASGDSRLRYIRQDANIGAAANFNAVLSEARGSFFMWLSDDDWLDANYISECVRAMTGQPDLAMVAGRCSLYDGSSTFKRDDPPTHLLQPTAAGRVLAYYATVGFNSVFYGVMRAEFARRIRMENYLASDWSIVASMAMLGKVSTLDSTRVHRTLGGTSRSVRNIVFATGLPSFQALMPRLTVTANSARFVLRAPWPDATPALARFRVSLLTFFILFVRYSWFRRLFPRPLRNAMVRRFA